MSRLTRLNNFKFQCLPSPAVKVYCKSDIILICISNNNPNCVVFMMFGL